jgi:hypothetical protein
MNLDTLEATLEKKEEKETVIMGPVPRVIDIIIKPKDEEFPDEDDDHELQLETDLSNALSLLEDCNNLLVTLADRRIRFITPYMHGEIERLSQEATGYLEQYNIGTMVEVDV